ncbi:MAG: VOC family protein [Phototrophicaceae bacterium]
MKRRVTGIGGIFFKAKNPEQLTAWYDKHLGISRLPHSPWGQDDESPLFEWRDNDNPEKKRYSVFGVFPENTSYFEPSKASFMFNFIVEDLDSLLSELASEGINYIDKIHEFPYGRFAHITDPEGNLIELFEPYEDFFDGQ